MKNAPRRRNVQLILYAVLILILGSGCSSDPSADFSITPPSGSILTTFLLDGSLSTDRKGEIVTYEWEIDDGTTAFGPVVEHTFAVPRDYLISLTVTDDDGNVDMYETDLTVEFPEPAEMLPASASLTVSPAMDVYTAVANSAGDIFELFLPPQAIEEGTEVTITALEDSPVEMAEVYSPGFRLEPDGLELHVPATVQITYGTEINNPDRAGIYQVTSDDGLDIVGWLEGNANDLEGKVYHFSDYVVGEPTDEQKIEILNNLEKIQGEVPLWIPLPVQELEDLVGKMLSAKVLGRDDWAESAVGIAINESQKYIDLPHTETDCDNLWDTLGYGRLVGRAVTMGGNGTDLARKFRERATLLLDQCALDGSISIHSYTRPPGITVGLSEPIFITVDPAEGLTGTGSGYLWIEGPGLLAEGARFRIEGGGNLGTAVSGESYIEEPFDVKLSADIGVTAVEDFVLRLYIKDGTGEIFFGDIAISGSEAGSEYTANFGMPIPFISLSGSTGPEDPTPIEFELCDGAQFIEEIPMDEFGVGVNVWTLSFP